MTDKKILFEEKQKFSKWWLWIILIAANLIYITGSYMQVIADRSFGDNPMSNTALLIITGIVLLLTLIYIFNRLDTQIKLDGVYVRFSPFHSQFKFYPWEDITKCHLEEYTSNLQFGGWGLRVGLFSGKEKVYKILGINGLRLEFKNQVPVFIGTNKPQELRSILKQLGKNKLPRGKPTRYSKE